MKQHDVELVTPSDAFVARFARTLNRLKSGVDASTLCIYTLHREFTWSEAKRATNIKTHGLDFVDAQSVFEGMTYTFEGDRFSYVE